MPNTGFFQVKAVEEHRSFDFVQNIVYASSGDMLLGNVKDADIMMENNCYWDTRTREPLFQNVPFKQWKKQKDKNSIMADPGFVDAENRDFRLKSLSVVRKIGFQPFDYSQAGVYGSEEWKQLAKLDAVKSAAFDAIVREMEK